MTSRVLPVPWLPHRNTLASGFTTEMISDKFAIGLNYLFV